MNVGVCATLAVGISASFCSPLIDITSWAPSLYPDTVFVVTTPVGAIYCIAFELSTLVPSPSSTRSPIWVSVEGVKLSNVISVEITTVAPFAAKLLYFVCVPCNWISIFFVPNIYTKFIFWAKPFFYCHLLFSFIFFSSSVFFASGYA